MLCGNIVQALRHHQQRKQSRKKENGARASNLDAMAAMALQSGQSYTLTIQKVIQTYTAPILHPGLPACS